MRMVFLRSLLLLPLFSLSGFAQSNDETFTQPKHASLPPPFSQLSAHDVLKQVFDVYDPATGRVANILNAHHKPTLVQIDEARLWKSDGLEYLAVLVELAADDYQFAEGRLCGNCTAYVVLAVLKKEEDNLYLVAKQTPPPSSVVGDDEGPSNPFESSMISGHSSLSLDLSPYRLSRKEALIGIRDELMIMGSHTVSLSLYRIEGQRLREVFRTSLLDTTYVSGSSIRKTTSTLSAVQRSSEFYDYVVNRTIITCIDRNDDFDCDLDRDRIKQIRKQNQLWGFNGKKFMRTLQTPKGMQRRRIVIAP